MEERYLLNQKDIDKLFDFQARVMWQDHRAKIVPLMAIGIYLALVAILNLKFNTFPWFSVIHFSLAIVSFCLHNYFKKKRPLEYFKALSHKDKEELIYQARIRYEIESMEREQE